MCKLWENAELPGWLHLVKTNFSRPASTLCLPSCTLPWQLVLLLSNLSHILLHPSWGRLPALPSYSKTSPVYRLQPLGRNSPNSLYFPGRWKHLRHVEMENGTLMWASVRQENEAYFAKCTALLKMKTFFLRWSENRSRRNVIKQSARSVAARCKYRSTQVWRDWTSGEQEVTNRHLR